MTNKLRIKSPRSRRAFFLAVIFIPLSLAIAVGLLIIEQAAVQLFAFAAFCCTLFSYLYWTEFVSNNREIEIDSPANLVVERRPTLAGVKTIFYPASQFTSVISYQSWHLPRPFRIELRSDGGSGLLLLQFLPQDQVDQKFEAAEYGEPEYCKSIRDSVCLAVDGIQSNFIKSGLPFWRYANRAGLTCSSSGLPSASAEH